MTQTEKIVNHDFLGNKSRRNFLFSFLFSYSLFSLKIWIHIKNLSLVYFFGKIIYLGKDNLISGGSNGKSGLGGGLRLDQAKMSQYITLQNTSSVTRSLDAVNILNTILQDQTQYSRWQGLLEFASINIVMRNRWDCRSGSSSSSRLFLYNFSSVII